MANEDCIELPQWAASEYGALRDELLQRIRLQHQLLGLSLIGAGTFLALGARHSQAMMILLIYPILVLLFA